MAKPSGTAAGDGDRIFYCDPRQWKDAGESTAFAGLAVDQQFGVMPFEDVLDDSEAETDTALLTAATGIHAEEPLGKTWNMLGFNTNTVIRDRQSRGFIVH